MWEINELFDDDFIPFFNKNNYDKIKINNNEEVNFISNKKYYIRFLHDLIDENFFGSKSNRYFNEFKIKFTRLKNRLYEILNENKNYIFLRFEESMENRIIYNEYVEKINISEIEHIIIFSNKIKNKFNLSNYLIIYFSLNSNDYCDYANKIITINISNYISNLEWENSHIILSIKYYDSL